MLPGATIEPPDADGGSGGEDAMEDGLEGSENSGAERKQRRKQRNRLSAAASRQRKKEWVEALQEQLDQLRRANDTLSSENATLQRQLAGGEPHAAQSSAAGNAWWSSRSACACQASAAASLLAFQALAPGKANDAIGKDLRLGRCLLEHGLTEALSIMIASEHLAKAASFAAVAGTGALGAGASVQPERVGIHGAAAAPNMMLREADSAVPCGRHAKEYDATVLASDKALLSGGQAPMHVATGVPPPQVTAPQAIVAQVAASTPLPRVAIAPIVSDASCAVQPRAVPPHAIQPHAIQLAGHQSGLGATALTELKGENPSLVHSLGKIASPALPALAMHRAVPQLLEQGPLPVPPQTAVPPRAAVPPQTVAPPQTAVAATVPLVEEQLTRPQANQAEPSAGVEATAAAASGGKGPPAAENKRAIENPLPPAEEAAPANKRARPATAAPREHMDTAKEQAIFSKEQPMLKEQHVVITNPAELGASPPLQPLQVSLNDVPRTQPPAPRHHQSRRLEGGRADLVMDAAKTLRQLVGDNREESMSSNMSTENC